MSPSIVTAGKKSQRERKFQRSSKSGVAWTPGLFADSLFRKILDSNTIDGLRIGPHQRWHDPSSPINKCCSRDFEDSASLWHAAIASCDTRHFRNPAPTPPLGTMAKYFFDFRADDAFSVDDEGEDLPDVAAAHREALAALADAIGDVVVEGAKNQNLTVNVRDGLGPVFEVTAVLGSTILRKQ